jgi:hypothetical protein
MIKSGLGRGSDHLISSPNQTENPNEKLLFGCSDENTRNSGFGGLLGILANLKAPKITFESPKSETHSKKKPGLPFGMKRLVSPEKK